MGKGFFDGCPTRQVVKKEPLHDDCSMRSEGFGQNRLLRLGHVKRLKFYLTTKLRLILTIEMQTRPSVMEVSPRKKGQPVLI